jgi:hypothetical protein
MVKRTNKDNKSSVDISRFILTIQRGFRRRRRCPRANHATKGIQAVWIASKV